MKNKTPWIIVFVLCVISAATGISAAKYRARAKSAEADFAKIGGLAQQLIGINSMEYADYFRESYERSSKMNAEWLTSAKYFSEAAENLFEMLKIQASAMGRSNARMTADEDKKFSMLRVLSAEKLDRVQDCRQRIQQITLEQSKASDAFWPKK